MPMYSPVPRGLVRCIHMLSMVLTTITAHSAQSNSRRVGEPERYDIPAVIQRQLHMRVPVEPMARVDEWIFPENAGESPSLPVGMSLVTKKQGVNKVVANAWAECAKDGMRTCDPEDGSVFLQCRNSEFVPIHCPKDMKCAPSFGSAHCVEEETTTRGAEFVKKSNQKKHQKHHTYIIQPTYHDSYGDGYNTYYYADDVWQGSADDYKGYGDWYKGYGDWYKGYGDDYKGYGDWYKGYGDNHFHDWYHYDSKYPVYDSKYPGYDKKYPSYDNKYPAYDNKYPSYDNKYPAYDNKYPSYDNKYPGYDNKYPAYDNKYPGYDNKYPAYDNKYPAYDNKYPGYANGYDKYTKYDVSHNWYYETKAPPPAPPPNPTPELCYNNYNGVVSCPPVCQGKECHEPAVSVILALPPYPTATAAPTYSWSWAPNGYVATSTPHWEAPPPYYALTTPYNPATPYYAATPSYTGYSASPPPYYALTTPYNPATQYYAATPSYTGYSASPPPYYATTSYPAYTPPYPVYPPAALFSALPENYADILNIAPSVYPAIDSISTATIQSSSTRVRRSEAQSTGSIIYPSEFFPAAEAQMLAQQPSLPGPIQRLARSYPIDPALLRYIERYGQLQQ